MTEDNETKATQGLGMSRRGFLMGGTAAAALAAAGLAGCTPQGGDSGSDASAADGEDAETTSSWLGEAPGITDDDCVDTLECEVLVVGAGHAGYFAATAAAEEGAQVMLIEQASDRGFSIRGDLGAVGSTMQAEQGVEIDKMDIVNDLVAQSSNYADASLWKVWADNSGEMIDWYADFVAEYSPEDYFYYEWNMPTEETRGKNWPTSHGTSWKYRYVNDIEDQIDLHMNDYIEGFEGCSVVYGTAMAELIKEDDRVVGVYASQDDGYVRINASKGVVVATGGYAANQEMVEALQPHANGLTGLSIDPSAMGDGIKACIWAGAKFEEDHTALVFDRGVIPPDEEVQGAWAGSGYYWHFSSQPWLKVNQYGERFCNEGGNYDYVFHAAQRFENRAWYPVWDSNWREDVERFHTTGCSGIFDWDGANGDGGTGTDDEWTEIEAMIEAGTVIESDTLEGLAEGLGIDPGTFVATCERYNELYDAQNDEDFGKDAFRLSQMANPPYYGAKMGGLLLCTLDGIKVNEEAQALDENDNVIEGLYVIGNDMGGFFHGTYPNLAVGVAAGRSATYGRMVGKALAQA